MATNSAIYVNAQEIDEYLYGKGISHYRLSKLTGISESSLSRLFRTNRTSRYHLLLINETLKTDFREKRREDK